MIPKNWEANHSPVLDKTHTASCEIRPPASAPVKANSDLSYTPTSPAAPIYSGGCRVQILSRATDQSDRLFGDEHQTDVGYLVAIDYAAGDITPGCLVKITGSNDPQLGGDLSLVVTRVEMGSLRFERDLFCVDPRHLT